MNDTIENKNKFKFNMSFYYQSTIAYFSFFILYVLIRGEFVEGSFTLITKDPIIYFFGLVVIVAVISLLYNLYKNRYLYIDENGIEFSNRNSSKRIKFVDIESIKLTRENKKKPNRAFRIIRVKLRNKRRVLLIRPYDYENDELLANKFIEIKEKLDRINV